jgi:hypothetical protein
MFQVVLSSNEHTEKVHFYKLLHNFLGQGLITSGGNLRDITVVLFADGTVSLNLTSLINLLIS